MAQITIGGIIGIPCDVKPGPFSDELLISFDTLDGQVSGFVKRENLKQLHSDEQWFVKCVVKAIDKNSIDVLVQGSFFTTNGLAKVSVETVAMAA